MAFPAAGRPRRRGRDPVGLAAVRAADQITWHTFILPHGTGLGFRFWRLYISPHTVSGHLRRVFEKRGINSRVALSRIAVGHAR